MKLFLQNLLIFFALSLCALISFQWVRETELRKDVQKLTDTVHNKMESIQTLEGAVKRDEAEIQRLDTLKNQFTQEIKSNKLEIVSLAKDAERATNEIQQLNKQVDAYKDALKKANDNIVKQNDDIKKQNEEVAKVLEDRNEVVKKFNKMAADYNALAAKWNQQQEELLKASTNAPAPPAKK